MLWPLAIRRARFSNWLQSAHRPNSTDHVLRISPSRLYSWTGWLVTSRDWSRVTPCPQSRQATSSGARPRWPTAGSISGGMACTLIMGCLQKNGLVVFQVSRAAPIVQRHDAGGPVRLHAGAGDWAAEGALAYRCGDDSGVVAVTQTVGRIIGQAAGRDDQQPLGHRPVDALG